MGDELDRHGLIGIFVTEAGDGLAKLRAMLHPVGGGEPAPAKVHTLYIVGHSIKGAASLYGFTGVANLGEILESALDRAGTVQADGNWPRIVAMLRDLVNALQAQADRISTTDAEDTGCFEAWAARYPGVTSTQPFPISPADAYPDAYLLPELDPEVMSFFAPEAQEYIETIETSLLSLEKNPDDAETIHKLFRAAHTLKGSAFTVGFQSIGDLTHHVEDYMGAVREGRQRVTAEATDVILKAIDVVKNLMKRDAAHLADLRADYAAAQQRLTLLEQETARAVVPQPAEQAEGTEAPRPQEAEPRAEPRTVVEASVIRVSRERLERLLNLVGELVISRGRLEQRLLALEQFSNQVQQTKGRMVDAVRSFEEKHTFNVPAQSTGGSPGGGEGEALPAFADFTGLEFDRYDDFNILARRMTEVSTDVGEVMLQLSGSIKKAQDDMGLLQRLTLDMRDEIARARMVPIGTPFTRFRRAVRETGRTTNKEVELVTSGEQTEVDTGVVERLVDPLVHLVRNAVYHGIEPTEVRIAQGKPAKGTVYLHAAHRGNSVVVEVEDDGGGLDVEKIKAKAVGVGILRPELAADLPYTDAIKLIFLPGFSTAERVGEQAGRGVGLDVVKRVIEAMNGSIDIETEKGVGTKFTLSLPFTLLISTALLVQVGSERYALLLSSIREVVMAKPGDIQDIGGRPVLQVGEETIEVRSLATMLGMGDRPPEGPRPVVVVRGATGVTGLAVDELLGRQEIVIKSLGPLKPFQRSAFGGASIDPEGRVVLVLDIGRLLAGRPIELAAPAQMMSQLPAGEEQEAQPAAVGYRVLLIDDSLSVRKFVGRMLERAGYAVDTAVDGEDGIRKATEGGYRLIITDLEMPKMNGYEVLQSLRQRTTTKTIPIMVMTTRAGEKHQQVAMSLGASVYLTKPVEEKSLIQAMEQWVGRPAAMTP